MFTVIIYVALCHECKEVEFISTAARFPTLEACNIAAQEVAKWEMGDRYADVRFVDCAKK